MSVLPPEGTISLARGVPTPDVFPVAELADCARAVVERDGPAVLNYGPPAGYPPLREWLAERAAVPAGQVLVTPGSLLALNLVVRALLAGGGAAVVELPTYDRMLRILAAAGAEIRAVPRGPAGLDLDALVRALTCEPRPKLLYTMPTFHNPTGLTLGRNEREQLVRIVAEHEVTLVEDDPYGQVRFAGAAQPSLRELAAAVGCDEWVVSSSSFSKTVAPGLRVGYVVAPPPLAAELERAATDLYVSPPITPQAQLFEYLRRGRFEPGLEHTRAVLRERHDAMLDALARDLPEGCAWTRPGGGYFLWLDLPPGIYSEELLERSLATGVSFVPGRGFFAATGGERSARLAFSFPTIAEIREGVRRLGVLLREPAPRPA